MCNVLGGDLLSRLFFRFHGNRLANSFEASLMTALLTRREMMKTVRERKRMLYNTTSHPCESHEEELNQPSRVNCVMPVVCVCVCVCVCVQHSTSYIHTMHRPIT